MPFFTNDWRLKEAYSDPGEAVQQEKSLDKLGTIFSDAKVGSMAHPEATQTSQQSLGAVSGDLPSFYPGASNGIPMIEGFPPLPRLQGMLSQGDLGEAYDEMFGSNLSPYESLQAWQNAPSWQRELVGKFNPYGGVKGIELAHGINPFRNFMPEGSQTTPWYLGETDFFGNPLSSAQLNVSGGFEGDYGSFFNQYEKDIADMYGWGSDEHLEAIGEMSGSIPDVTGDDTGGLFSGISDTLSGIGDSISDSFSDWFSE